MDQYVGLDVSLKETFVCVVDACGEVVCEKSIGTTPETMAKFIEKRAPGAVRVGLESGLLSTWLWHGLLKPFGLLVGKVRDKGFEGRVRDTIMWRAGPDHGKNHGPGSDGRRA